MVDFVRNFTSNRVIVKLWLKARSYDGCYFRQYYVSLLQSFNELLRTANPGCHYMTSSVRFARRSHVPALSERVSEHQ